MHIPNKLGLLLLALWLALPIAHAQAVRVDQITLTVSNLKRTEAFYRAGLGFEKVSERSFSDTPYAHLLGIPGAKVRSLIMQLGSEEVEFQQISPAGRGYWPGSRSPDLWFQHFAIIVSNMELAYAQLKRVKFEPISSGGPQTLPPQNGYVKAFKFRDPDGHPLELLHFPAGQGREVWQQAPGQKIFLGIDHTAIGVSDTTRSERFYKDLLGMDIAYQVLNSGPTQERLDGTFNAVVEITGLRPESPEGPGVEFLDYRAPATGRLAPKDTQTNDIAHAHLKLTVRDLQKTAKELFEARVPMISPGVVEIDSRLHGFSRGLLVRDPDGHPLMLTELPSQQHP